MSEETNISGERQQGYAQQQNHHPQQQQQQQYHQGGGAASVGAGEWLVEGKFAPGLSSRLSDDLKPYAGSIRKFEGTPIQDVLKSYGELEKKLGQRVQPPGPEARPEEVAVWRKNMGVPEGPEGYGITRPEDVPAEMWSDDLARGFAEVAHKHHLSAAAANELVSWWNGQQQAALAQYQQQQQQGGGGREVLVHDLQRDWGDKFEANLYAAQRVAGMAKLDVNDPSIGDNPAVIRALHAMSALISEDRQVTGGNGALRLTRLQQADDIQTSRTNPLYDDYHGANGAERQAMAAEQVRRLRMG